MTKTTHLDCRGLKCPEPMLKLTTLFLKANPGELIEILADCPTFENDLRAWCEKTKRSLLWIRDEGAGAKKALVRL